MFQNMDYIYEVYKEKSFSRAAKNLYLSQSSLSLTVKSAEKRIAVMGSTLAKRLPKNGPTLLTPYKYREYATAVPIKMTPASISNANGSEGKGTCQGLDKIDMGTAAISMPNPTTQ